MALVRRYVLTDDPPGTQHPRGLLFNRRRLANKVLRVAQTSERFGDRAWRIEEVYVTPGSETSSPSDPASD